MNPISKDAIQQIFTEARSHNVWHPKTVSDQKIQEIYDLMKWGPTSANLSPARFVFIRTETQKTKLLSAVAPTNVEKVKAAPVTVIVAQDEHFFEESMIAARALGLDCGPLSGFDNNKVDELFLSGTHWKSNFLCNLGYGDAAKLFPRNPRLNFEEACKIL